MRVLVLQEILANAERIKEALGHFDGEIICVNSQPEAMEYLNREAVELIVTAVHLQSGNVFDFLKWVKGDPLNQHAAFVFFCAEPTEVSRYVWPAVQTAALVLGADKYIAMDKFDRNGLRNELITVMKDNAARRLRAKSAMKENRDDPQNRQPRQPFMLIRSLHSVDGHEHERDGHSDHDGHDAREGHKRADGKH